MRRRKLSALDSHPEAESLDNLVAHTPAGGEIALIWGLDGEQPVFAVRDSGGTGLGLSIVKHILLRHEARLGIDSELGRGSTFRCVFPAARLTVAIAVLPCRSRRGTRPGGRPVLTARPIR